ncbi:Tm-1-like ATP-binding domain-containing protein [Flavilitoribacter nigricans]|uniref:Uncharacterized protein n=1 Tax=Flavilitoribacter nigricans (strain ATCC 23147 / DSM 23189 / NBRC 102662 / NCIMB 1420 / SS-2) TaxID=1122177 RepID=A0A2D0MYZ9_FLAN2|nr:Tm-1-like ATP-binding domain-containing protein [Flavilitoribacter nigricans]PHN01400.1 hypothetical protein CRP01_37065 [Flavilitoribacter nigricans DSM 23189 = NBRC 102662]
MANTSNETTKQPTVVMLGCFDTKGEDFQYLYNCLSTLGARVISINTGVQDVAVDFPISISAESVAQQNDCELEALKNSNDRNLVVQKMGQGAAGIISGLLAKGEIDGAISMGGGGGTYMALLAMQALPIGMPKLCLSTVAAKDLSRQVGTRDITLMPSVVDVAGLNRISRLLISQAAGAIYGMMTAPRPTAEHAAGTIAISMFGNTTPCVEHCTRLLKQEGYEVLAFHSVGVGGRTMEALIREGFFDALLDITTTELADDLCDGICSAGPDRLTAAAQTGIPQVVVPGCLDMVNYGHMDTVPEKFQSRQLFSWAPDVTLMRTNVEENRILGRSIAEKLNEARDQVAILLPLGGISKISSQGESFYDPQADAALFGAIKENIRPTTPVAEVDANINDVEFAERAVATLLAMLRK